MHNSIEGKVMGVIEKMMAKVKEESTSQRIGEKGVVHITIDLRCVFNRIDEDGSGIIHQVPLVQPPL